MQETVNISNPNFTASLTLVNPDELGQSAVLYWTDGVANEWREIYGNLSTGMLRLAQLIYGADELDQNNPGWFAFTQNEFEEAAHLFNRIAVVRSDDHHTNPQAKLTILRLVLNVFKTVDEQRQRDDKMIADASDYKVALAVAAAPWADQYAKKD